MSRFKAPALAKGLDIIDLIRDKGALSFNEIQDYTNENAASLSRYLHTLMAKYYVHKNGNNKYELGLKLIGLSDNRSMWSKLLKLSKTIMIEINNEYGITVLLLAYSNDSFIALDKIVAPDNLGMMAKNTVEVNGPESIWSNYFYEAYKEEAITSDQMEIDELPKDHAQIYDSIRAYGHMMYLVEEKCILRLGFPIYYKKQVIATIGIGTFVNRLSEEQVKMVRNRILEYIQEVQNILEK